MPNTKKSPWRPPTTSSSSSDPPPLYFHSPTSPSGFLCNWFPSAFTDPTFPEHTFAHVEQYMMYRKAILFAPAGHAIVQKILSEKDPRTCKKYGREVPGWDEVGWGRVRYGVVRRGVWLKFSQNGRLGRKLVATGGRELVEASPRDRVWGVGFNVERAEAHRGEWGLNLLGKALMEVRGELRRREEEGLMDEGGVRGEPEWKD